MAAASKRGLVFLAGVGQFSFAFVMSKSEEIQATINQLRKEIGETNPHMYPTPAVIAKKQSEIFVLASQLTEISSQRLERQTDELVKQTDRLVDETILLRRFTKGVFWLTVVLVIFTVALIVIAYLEYAAKANERIKAGIQYHQAG